MAGPTYLNVHESGSSIEWHENLTGIQAKHLNEQFAQHAIYFGSETRGMGFKLTIGTLTGTDGENAIRIRQAALTAESHPVSVMPANAAAAAAIAAGLQEPRFWQFADGYMDMDIDSVTGYVAYDAGPPEVEEEPPLINDTEWIVIVKPRSIIDMDEYDYEEDPLGDQLTYPAGGPL